MSVHGANQEEMEKLEPQTLLDVTAGLMLIAQASMHVLAEEEETTYEDTLEFMLTSAEFEYSMSLVEEPPLSSD